MSLYDLVVELAQTGPSRALNESRWAFAVIEMGHLLALTAAGGAVIVMCLSAFGVGLRQATSKVTAELGRWADVNLALVILTGALMALSDPLKYYENPTFRVKIALLVVAIAGTVVFRLHLRHTPETTALTRLLAALGLLLWIAVALAGRLIGYLSF